MKICCKAGCQNIIPTHIVVDGKRINFQRRKYCINCSPLNHHNTRNLNKEKPSSYTHVKNFRKRQKQRAVDYKGGKCHLCHYTKCNEALSFHHLDPSKKDFSIAAAKSWSFDKIKKELDKCVMLCNRCHTEVHHGISFL